MRRRDFIAALSGAVAWVGTPSVFPLHRPLFNRCLSTIPRGNGGVFALRQEDGPGSVIKVTKKDGAVTMRCLAICADAGSPTRVSVCPRKVFRNWNQGELRRESFCRAGYFAKLEGTADFEKLVAHHADRRFRRRCRRFRRLTNWMASPVLSNGCLECAMSLGPRRYLSRQRGFSNQ